MIRVRRDRVAAPAVLSSQRALREGRRAHTFFSGGAADAQQLGSKQFVFAVYKDDEVKRRLHELFGGKCAYCESRYAATQPMDVEHFRPKSRATDFDGTASTGYYWLAADWANLLPSCIDCNRPRNHEQSPNGNTVLLGKDTLFPLVPGTRRTSYGANVGDEQPLLLDPCRDDPEKYLSFVEAVVEPAAGAETPADAMPRVNACVRVFGLNRTELVQERYRVLLDLRRRFHQVRTLMVGLAAVQRRRGSAARDTVERTFGDLISYETESILQMASPTEPYSLMVRQEIEKFEVDLGYRRRP